MDPTETLYSFLSACQALGGLATAGDEENEHREMIRDEIAEHAESLATWLMRDGFAPDAWAACLRLIRASGCDISQPS